jgi:mannose-6-phosphate isomerase class I
VYSTKAQEFKLSIVTLSEGEPYKAQISSGARNLLCIEGKARIMDSDKALDFGMGESIFIPARHSCYTLRERLFFSRLTTP